MPGASVPPGETVSGRGQRGRTKSRPDETVQCYTIEGLGWKIGQYNSQRIIGCRKLETESIRERSKSAGSAVVCVTRLRSRPGGAYDSLGSVRLWVESRALLPEGTMQRRAQAHFVKT